MFDETNTKDWQRVENGVYLLQEIPGRLLPCGGNAPLCENKFSILVQSKGRMDRGGETELAGKIVAALNGASWQTERPTAGKWRLAVRLELRGRDYQNLSEVSVDEEDGDVWIDWPTGKRVPAEILDGALWLPRETPADPFKGNGQP